MFDRFFMLLLLLGGPLFGFQKVVIWGHKLHSHTHSYVHEAFYRAFTHLGYKTLWLDETDDLTEVDFANSLFLTEGQADGSIPLRDDCHYLLHNCTSPKYHALAPKNWLSFQVFTNSIFTTPSLQKVDTCIYYDLPGRCLYMPWATDLLPNEIEELERSLDLADIQKDEVLWIGTLGEGRFGNLNEIDPFIDACEENGLHFIQRAHIERDEHIELIRKAYMAPALVGTWQKEVDYVPCRIFKNLSYGKLGITNSPIIFELFEGKVVFNRDTHALFYDAQRRLQTQTREETIELMELIKTKHTYVQRIHLLLQFMELVEKSFS